MTSIYKLIYAILHKTKMINTSKISGHSQFIELLRGGLAVWVLLAHLIPWTVLANSSEALPSIFVKINQFFLAFFQGSGDTHPAVLGFIVLSGYCIHRNGFREGPLEIKKYACRRFFRIYPVYGAAALFGILCFEFNQSISAETTVALSGTSFITFWQVAAKMSGISAFLPFLHQPTMQGNGPLHTVMVECWLYAVYPLATWLFLKRNRESMLWIALILIWAAGMAAIALKPSWAGWWHNGSIFSFLMYWWIGAKFLDKEVVKKAVKYLPLLLLAWLFLTSVGYFGKLQFIFFVEIKKILFCLLFASTVSYFDLFRNNSGMDKEVVVGLFWKRFGLRVGKSSYSLYAFHAPLLHLLILNRMNGAAAFIAAILCGLLMFEILEKPMIRFGKMVYEPAALELAR